MAKPQLPSNSKDQIKETRQSIAVTTFSGDTPTWVVISKFTNFWSVDAKLSEKLNKPIEQTDLGIFHVILAAIQSHPDKV
jgi:hypothetical protein